MSRIRFVVSAVCLITALALVPRPVHSEGKGKDPDSLDDATLQHDLEAELDDVYIDHDPDTEFDIDDLKEWMLEALRDDGDDGDDAEEEIDFDDLESDMEEAGTTIPAVLDEALAQADAIASNEQPRGSIVRVSVSVGSAVQRRGNGRTTPRQATQQAVRLIIRASNAR